MIYDKIKDMVSKEFEIQAEYIIKNSEKEPLFASANFLLNYKELSLGLFSISNIILVGEIVKLRRDICKLEALIADK